MVADIGAAKEILLPRHNMIKQSNGALETVLIKYDILEPIGNFIPTSAGKSTVWNAAGEAVKVVTLILL